MLHKLKKIDIPIVVILLAFMVISTLLVYSATLDDPNIVFDMKKIVTIYIIAILAFIGVTFADYRALVKISPYLYITGLALVAAVYKFGMEINGAKSWFSLPGGLLFQPAELMKLLLIIGLAAFLARREGDPLFFWKDVVPVGAIVIVPFVLVLIQPDLGNAIIFLVVFVGMLWIGNVKYFHFLIGVALAVAGLMLFLYLFVHYHDPIKTFFTEQGKGHWVARIDTFIDPDSATKDQKFQVDNSIKAIGSGGLTGEKYLQGTSVHRHFIPYAYSDSIFVVLAEEFGFVGSSVLLLLYFILIYRMILISIQCGDKAGAYIIVGVVSMFVFQIFENVGMLIGIMPLTGITLPFISYGGTSLLINMVSIALVMSIRVHQEKEPSY
ncbi:FtsW/RodA/SpoVE family cell cycle protein [Paenibacillus doosanensis]|uniref:Rod shape-determining protein RodA n=1 Tax=Paenibacillus konkukensis TaxID=2020716 RepID=A0ABY4RVR2_9BACL|nr:MULTISPECIES: FtsW/RodA/SpoVE family cell cycle protein [Paenibacillus]MCS7458721.1 FtsW/RodA/SpoVE family cell cycle protein [Paenibacillus doosanensis]UQZ86754.1 Rod shape-determining protein RodA [Paenibacillus konkukensis]